METLAIRQVGTPSPTPCGAKHLNLLVKKLELYNSSASHLDLAIPLAPRPLLLANSKRGPPSARAQAMMRFREVLVG